MPAFVATCINPRGKSFLVDIEATDPAHAKRSLRLRGIRATEIKAKPKTTATGSSAAAQLSEKLKFSKLNELLEAKPGIKDKAVFASKMSALVNAGVPIVRSIDLMASQQKMPLFKRALQSISLEVNQGISLGEALRRWPKVFDKLSIAMVEAGEAGGVLDESLKRLAKLLEDNAKLQNQIKGAMGYPVAVLFIAISVFLGMTIFIIPTFAGIFDGLGAELPWFTQMMVDLSSLLRSTFSLYLVLGLIAGVFLFGKFYATPIGRRRVDALVLKLPLFGELIQKTATAQFCRTFSSLTRAGVPILMSLDIVREITNNSIISDAISNSRQDVLQGIPLSVALGRMNVFPNMSISMLSIGEETGEMDAMLSKVADFYEDEVEATVKALTSMLEPAMIVLVGGIVASILLAMYLPMFSVFDQIK
ncbi:type II secretion system F family protein [Cyanobium sp. BA5m-21]|uniref:type II secretion system F family protein n=1 Tax=unclassified Cyanobium TaxID=2627006 RepID=UPI0020CFDF13|nr:MULTISPECIES: type II secretion system F family protein [unclassified Cyanobium]MCP9903665.1 type II secretion system F family protein [Cyanobium sp. BA5m-10]MCP9905881.1 type II secretion system F family protein [Cyanobium sp. BA5m-21]